MENRDLVWDLETIKKRQHAQNFVMGIENQLCVYSPSVEQLYSNYNIFFPREENRKLVILPNPYAHHDTFYNVPDKALRATGLFLVPSDPQDSYSKLNLVIPFKSEKSGYKVVPLGVGVTMVRKRCKPEKPFLPVLMKGDLREIDKETPCLHLHSLVMPEMKNLSQLEIEDIKMVIDERLENLIKQR